MGKKEKKHSYVKSTDIRKIYRNISSKSNQQEIKKAQKELEQLYRTRDCSFPYLCKRYYYLKSYDSTLATQISFLFSTATTFAVALLSKDFFARIGITGFWNTILVILFGFAVTLFFTFRGIYIGIAVGVWIMPVKRLFLFPYELKLVEKKLIEIGLSI